jgi:hypothetical protein
MPQGKPDAAPPITTPSRGHVSTRLIGGRPRPLRLAPARGLRVAWDDQRRLRARQLRRCHGRPDKTHDREPDERDPLSNYHSSNHCHPSAAPVPARSAAAPHRRRLLPSLHFRPDAAWKDPGVGRPLLCSSPEVGRSAGRWSDGITSSARACCWSSERSRILIMPPLHAIAQANAAHSWGDSEAQPESSEVSTRLRSAPVAVARSPR